MARFSNDQEFAPYIKDEWQVDPYDLIRKMVALIVALLALLVYLAIRTD
ncbi:hypothetical protein DSCO28_07240 [Desulfosarcina ovata subsp. sediminis]|uniref:Uncharacterized protein n=1 Tax=Desulfosarcina ovata subsp. sediminis TaxID=885957 RepID=A0A5K7ZD94_9BACT|nr:hypothetical protein DSCO28_07240 [Desulfosarcina ovata subsp. sediminis]